MGTHGVVAAEHPLEARAGLHVLESGGNAFDAAVAVFYMTGVVEQHQAGIGGDACIGHLRADGSNYQACLCNEETYRHWNYAIRPDIDSAGPSHGSQNGLYATFANSHRAFLVQAQARPGKHWLSHAIQEHFGRAAENQYNLEVLLALTQYIDLHWRLIIGLAQMERLLEMARPSAHSKPKEALVQLSDAYKLSVSLESEVCSRFGSSVMSLRRDDFPKDVLLAIKSIFMCSMIQRIIGPHGP